MRADGRTNHVYAENCQVGNIPDQAIAFLNVPSTSQNEDQMRIQVSLANFSRGKQEYKI
ncbi:hypothetical protein [Xenococcus sp. PCC 7305]|uniref:hypothetical protein n=1 Tax=Xenococcus sp. PCC 7305 TaxID=102125 RepID=UPI00031E5C69|nr:hypothetical protein [Xenococcus sp. PCC 7305]